MKHTQQKPGAAKHAAAPSTQERVGAPQPAPPPPGPPPAQHFAPSPRQVVYRVADPGETLGILSIIMPFVFLAVLGLIFGLIGRKRSREAGFDNGLALAGIWISAGVIALYVLLVGMFFVMGAYTGYTDATKY